MSATPKDLVNDLISEESTTRQHAADALVAIGKEATPVLLAALRENAPGDYKPIILVLKRIADSRAIEPLQQIADTTDDDLIRVLAGGAARAIERKAVSSVEPHKPTEPRIEIPQHMAQKPKLCARVLTEPTPATRPKASRNKTSAFEKQINRHLDLLHTPDYTARGDAANFFKFNASRAIPILQRRLAGGERSVKPALDIAKSTMQPKKRSKNEIPAQYRTGLF